MKLITKEIQRRMPMLYAQEGMGMDAQVHLKLFTPFGRGTWFATEGAAVLEDGTEVPMTDPRAVGAVDFNLFGYHLSNLGGVYDEWCYFALSQLEGLKRGPLALVERDRHFPQQTVADALARP